MLIFSIKKNQPTNLYSFLLLFLALFFFPHVLFLDATRPLDFVFFSQILHFVMFLFTLLCYTFYSAHLFPWFTQLQSPFLFLPPLFSPPVVLLFWVTSECHLFSLFFLTCFVPLFFCLGQMNSPLLYCTSL